MKTKNWFVILSSALVAIALFTGTVLANTTVVVTSNDLESNKVAAMSNGKWVLYNDENDTVDSSLGSFVSGPGTPPSGIGSLQISVSGTQRRNIATYKFSGTPLANITTLAYSTYNPTAGDGGGSNRSGYLQFNVDFNGTDTWQRRLVFLPADNGTIVKDSWQEWDAINGGNAKWRYSGGTWPVDGLSGSTPKTLGQIIAQYPGVRIRVTDAFLGIRVGEPYANGYTENIDAFKFGTVSSDVVTYDFEPYNIAKTKEQCMNNGWQVVKRADGSSFKNQGDCIQYVNTGK